MSSQPQSVEKEKKYTVRIVIGLLIITGGILADAFKLSPPTTMQQPNPQDIDQMMTISTGFPSGFMVILGIFLGGGLNLYSIYRYSEQTSGILDIAKTRKTYLLLGILLTVLALVAAAYAYAT